MFPRWTFAASWVVLAAGQAGAYELPRTIAEAEQMERANALPRTAFYSEPTDLTASAPGGLLRREVFSGYQLPTGTRAVRILYHSVDAHGVSVAASAVVLTPGGPAPNGGWPVIAWAHGTSGVAQQCAPSLMKDLYYGDEGLSAMLQTGFAVVAVDYHGLGTQGPHQYVSKIAQARDVIYSLPAARAAVPDLGHRWVVDGHSQGGLAAWGVAELESAVKDDAYLGAVSVAGAVKLDDFMTYINDTQGGAFYLAYLAAGIHAVFPEFKPEEILTANAMRLYARATTRGCWYYGYALFRDMPKHSALKPNWRTNRWVQQYVKADEQGETRVIKPLLVLAGEADLTVPIDGVRRIVQRTCRNGSSIVFKSYPGLDHDPTMVESTPYQLDWIHGRFSGTAAAASCETH